jgi:hypothetical protein
VAYLFLVKAYADPVGLARCECRVFFVATTWRSEARSPGGIPSAWLVAGLASLGSIVLILLIALKISWWIALLCIAASFFGQLLFIPLDRAARTVVSLWIGIAILFAAGGYIVHRVFSA